MVGNSSLFTLRSHLRQRNEDAGTNSNKQSPRRCRTAGIVLAAFLVSLFFCGTAVADYLSPSPPMDNISNQTYVSVALTSPATTVYINVTEYDAQQMVKNITIDFREPVTYVGLVIDVLRDKPLIVNAPDTVPVIQYYDVRFLTGLASNITNFTMVFSVERDALKNMSVAEGDLLHYQYNGTRFEGCPMQKVGENKTHLYFETETTVSPCFAITGAAVPAPWWSLLVPIAGITLLAIIGIYVYRRYKSNRPLNPVRT